MIELSACIESLRSELYSAIHSGKISEWRFMVNSVELELTVGAERKNDGPIDAHDWP